MILPTFAHIINPVVIDARSDLFTAQPVTFKAMVNARSFYQSRCGSEQVSLVSAQFAEDRKIVPQEFRMTPDLERSVLDVGSFKLKRKLPLISDILDRVYEHSGAEYLIYTNVDIALQPFFYWTAAALISRGHDAFAVNRRTIAKDEGDPLDVDRLSAEIGSAHRGWDCFIFRRELYPGFVLGDACIGMDWFGRVMISNLSCLAQQFAIFTDLQMTFHLGNRRPWKTDRYADYAAHNRAQCRLALNHFERRFGRLDRTSIPGKFLNR